MNDLVYLAPNTQEPFTTSEVIAECVRVKRDTIQKLIQRHETDFREFERVGFEIRPLQTKGGEQMGKVYHLNEQLAYRAALGKSARQLRQERGAANTATASDYMSSEEITAVSSMENHIAVLLNVGMECQQIKGYLARMRTLPAAGNHAG